MVQRESNYNSLSIHSYICTVCISSRRTTRPPSTTSAVYTFLYLYCLYFQSKDNPSTIDYVRYLYIPIFVLFVFPVEGQPVHHRLRGEGELTEVTRWILPRALLRLLQEGE